MSSFFLISLALGGLIAFASFAEEARAQDADHPVVVMETTLGTVTIELDKAKAPITVENFLKYADAKFYDNQIFHRVIPGFMAQGGGYSESFQEKGTGAPIKNEASNGLKNLRGTIAMARTNDPNSATAQFFINLADNDFLNASPGSAGYAVFGKVTSGMEVVDEMAKVPTTGKGPFPKDVPSKTILIKSIRRKTS